MNEEVKNAVKKFLHAVKNAVMAMDVETLKDEQIADVWNGFVLLSESIPEEEGGGE